MFIYAIKKIPDFLFQIFLETKFYFLTNRGRQALLKS